MLFIFTLAIFHGALLLFVVQPMFARMILPLLGGSPSVWNTAMLFYQMALLGGYLYAHYSCKWLGLRKQMILHLALVALAIVSLPLAIPDGWSPPTDSNPVFWLLGVLCISVGLPFFAISATSPVVQRWFAASRHSSAADPYFLYAASNAGSLLALVAYPFLIEPNIGLLAQSKFWSAGYIGLLVLLVACVALVWKAAREGPNKPPESKRKTVEPNGGKPILWKRRLRWLALAFVPSSLMLSVTTYLSSEVASVPLLWVIPLAFYLLTFTLVFARHRLLPHVFVCRAFPIAVISLTLLLMTQATNPFLLLASVHLVVFFIAAMACHGEMANDRPNAAGLTEFYLWMSIGGALGGMFNALVAPLVFNSIAEYPLVLIIACLLIVKSTGNGGKNKESIQWRDFLAPAVIGTVTLVLIFAVPRFPSIPPELAHMLVFVPPVLACFFLSGNKIRFTGSVAAIFLANLFYVGGTGKVLFAERSFFGVHRVTEDPQRGLYQLMHGTTVHGLQRIEEAGKPIPLSYYYPIGPAGDFFKLMENAIDGPVAAIGMGAGAMAYYGKPDQEWVFYEIDPVVAEVASSSPYFSYLETSDAEIEIILGDGRFALTKAPNGKFQVIIVDAFSSDVIPVHLLTREALDLYITKLTEDGAILFHVSNRHFNLKPVLANLALDAGFVCYWQDGKDVTFDDLEKGQDPSEWMVIARTVEDVEPITNIARWQRIERQQGDVLWTDDRSSILDVLFP